MALTTSVSNYLRDGGATSDEIDDFLNFCSIFKEGGIKARYEVYRLWARLLRHRRTPFKKHGKFDFDGSLKWYLRSVTKGDVVDDDPPPDAIVVTKEQFVRYVLRHLDEAF